jgi:hypothetical protein
MGWLFAVLFMAVAVLLGFLLISGRKDTIDLQAKLQGCGEQVGKLEAAAAERDKLAAAYATLRKRVQGIVDADQEKARVLAEAKTTADKFNAQLAAAKEQFASRKQAMESELAEQQAEQNALREALAAELARIKAELSPLRAEHRALSEEAALSDMGFYKAKYGFATSERYKKAIGENYAAQKDMLTAKAAATCSKEWAIDGSVEKGRKHTDKYLALLLRAFNGECDSAIAKVKATNFQTMENRITKAFDSLNKLGEMSFCAISPRYRDLRLDELRLEHEHALKVQAEREEQRAIKEEMRQQAIAERELERAQQEAEREERQYEAALAKARADFESASAAKQAEMQAKLAELEQMVAEAHANKERAISRAQQTKSGHVYIISNLGAFGANIYKIGMTRRLDPMDRIWELSDASVPFDFDVHAIIYTDDAPGLETELHQRFTTRRVNVVNQKKEFFNVTIDEIATVVRERCGDIELTLVAEAAEYLQSEAFHRENGQPMSANRVFSPLASLAASGGGDSSSTQP